MAPFLGALAIIVIVVVAIAFLNGFGGDGLNEGQRVGRARFVDDVAGVVIDGDRATGTVTYHFDKAPDAKTAVAMTFVREDGSWKVCSTGPS
jgi:hypothetical protein